MLLPPEGPDPDPGEDEPEPDESEPPRPLPPLPSPGWAGSSSPLASKVVDVVLPPDGEVVLVIPVDPDPLDPSPLDPDPLEPDLGPLLPDRLGGVDDAGVTAFPLVLAAAGGVGLAPLRWGDTKAGAGSVLTCDAAARARAAPRRAAVAARATPIALRFMVRPSSRVAGEAGTGRWS